MKRRILTQKHKTVKAQKGRVFATDTEKRQRDKLEKIFTLFKIVHFEIKV